LTEFVNLNLFFSFFFEITYIKEIIQLNKQRKLFSNYLFVEVSSKQNLDLKRCYPQLQITTFFFEIKTQNLANENCFIKLKQTKVEHTIQKYLVK